MIKGIAKSLKGANVTLSGKQRKVPGAKPAPKFKPRDRKAGNKFTKAPSKKA